MIASHSTKPSFLVAVEKSIREIRLPVFDLLGPKENGFAIVFISLILNLFRSKSLLISFS